MCVYVSMWICTVHVDRVGSGAFRRRSEIEDGMAFKIDLSGLIGGWFGWTCLCVNDCI